MIYTVTFNPSIDYIVSMHHFTLGKTNRTTAESMFPGGKGLNVSTVLTNLGIENTALGFLAGFTGAEIERLSKSRGILCDFITLPEGNNRINVKLKDYDGTEINGLGPNIPDAKLQELIKQLHNLNRGDTLVLAGSIPSSLPNDIYQQIMQELEHKESKIVVDAGKNLLLNCLPYHPFLIKPNKHELEEIFDVIISSKKEAIHYARLLQEQGAQNVLVSLSGSGAVLVSKDGKELETDVPPGTLVNAVGAGDSMIAGFLAGFETSKDYEQAFRMAVACGSASAYSEELATQEEVMTLLSYMG